MAAFAAIPVGFSRVTLMLRWINLHQSALFVVIK